MRKLKTILALIFAKQYIVATSREKLEIDIKASGDSIFLVHQHLEKILVQEELNHAIEQAIKEANQIINN